VAYSDWLAVGPVGGARRRLCLGGGTATDDGDGDDEFVSSLLAMIVRSSFCKQTATGSVS